MGVYILSTKELCQAMAEALDTLEGDFSKEGLLDALEKMGEYPFVTDRKSNGNKWRAYLSDAERGN